MAEEKLLALLPQLRNPLTTLSACTQAAFIIRIHQTTLRQLQEKKIRLVALLAEKARGLVDTPDERISGYGR
jgi:hypothetical protein